MKYRLELAEDFRDYRATAYAEFRNDELMAPEADGYRYFVDGKPVTRREALDAANAAADAAWAKKEQTHKRVRVSVGASTCDNTYREVWVRK
mgnify:FL=1